MNVFLPYPNDLGKSVESLDNVRLNKQILECEQILKVICGHSTGYANHPIVKHYVQYPDFIARYTQLCLAEYYFRNHRLHSLNSEVMFFVRRFKTNDYSWREGFVPIYVQYGKNDPRCIRETDSEKVAKLYQTRLIEKWKEDIAKGRHPNWGYNGAPTFAAKELELKK